jgi:ribA/ribD-fused uncharacterized protein
MDRYFYHDHCPESNFYYVDGGITHNGLNLPTSEHHFMYAKAMLMGDKCTANLITKATTPTQAKRLGRKVKPFDDLLWQQARGELVTQILVSKFSKPELKEHLLGISERDAKKGTPHNGLNLLGKCLMNARSILSE